MRLSDKQNGQFLGDDTGGSWLTVGIILILGALAAYCWCVPAY